MASTHLQNQNVVGESITQQPSTNIPAKVFDNQSGPGIVNRKSLQTLQYSSKSKKELVGKDGPIKQNQTKGKIQSKLHVMKKKNMIKPSKKPVEVFQDPSPEENKDVNAVDDEAYQLMGSETVPDSYWKLLAEERRMALDDSLHENEMLYQEIEGLKEENSRLSELATQAEYFASVLQTAIESSSEDEAESDQPDDEVRTEEAESNIDRDLESYDVISLTDDPLPVLSDEESNAVESKPSDDENNQQLVESNEVNDLISSTRENNSPVVSSDEKLTVSPVSQGQSVSELCSSPNTANEEVPSASTPVLSSSSDDKAALSSDSP